MTKCVTYCEEKTVIVFFLSNEKEDNIEWNLLLYVLS